MKVVVAQRGAREHFLAARALHQRGCLSRLVVDWYAPCSALVQALVRRMGRSGASALGARAKEIPDSMVTSLWLNGLWGKWQERRAEAVNRLYDCYPKTDSAFASRVARVHLPDHDAFFGYSYSSLEMLRSEKKHGRLTIVCQTDPGPSEFRLVVEEMRRFPKVAGAPLPFPVEHYNRVRLEWEVADVIIVNSEWSRQALVSEGANPGKIEILPLAYEAASFRPAKDFEKLNPSRPLRVLWLGQVNVRKGIHYLIEAARLLEKQPVEISVAGPIQIRSDIIDSAPRALRFLGAIPRSQASQAYQEHDVFALPTLSDGFAITQLEAFAHGMPVIATPHCGRVVKEGETGFIVPARDPVALARAISCFANDRKLVSAMSGRCMEAAKKFSIKAYADGLVEILERRMKKQS